jgi:hypothetical protein
MVDFKIEKADWARFFDWLTRRLAGGRIEIDVLSLDLGAQVEAQSLPLLGASYDRKSNVIEIAVEGLDHLIHRPRELTATEGETGLLSIQIVDEDGVRQIIKLKQPLALPAPGAKSEPPPWKREPAKSKVGKRAS